MMCFLVQLRANVGTLMCVSSRRRLIFFTCGCERRALVAACRSGAIGRYNVAPVLLWQY